jgi:5-formyltetrahydrofolate cyclo-ligase
VKAAELKAWRVGLRAEKIAARLALDAAARAQMTESIGKHVLERLERAAPQVVAFTWPMRGEVDLRPIAERSLAENDRRRLVLPVVVGRRQPLIFRVWTPETIMVEQKFGVMVPRDGEELRPDFLLVPTVAFDAACYRLGYGGGYFDRTLAAANPRPVALGISFELGRVPTIHPQAWDVPLDAIVTENGLFSRDHETQDLATD